MVTNPEENVDLILPLLNDVDPDVRWEAIHYITRTDKFLGNSEIIGLVIKSLLEDPSPDVRIDAADALGYCKAPEAKVALLWARDHDFEVGFQGHVVSRVAEDALERLIQVMKATDGGIDNFFVTRGQQLMAGIICSILAPLDARGVNLLSV